MNIYMFTERQRVILRQLRDKAIGEKKQFIEYALSNSLARNDIEIVCQMINSEFLMNGINKDYSPTEYGRELEGLLDVINRPRLR